MDDFGPSLTLGLGLAGHGALHLLRQVNMLDLDVGDLDPPGIGLAIEDFLQLQVDAVAVREQFVEFALAQHAAQRGLGQLAGGIEVVFDLDQSFFRLHHTKVKDRVDLHRDVVLGDHILRRNIHGYSAQADFDNFVDHRNDKA